MCALSTQDLSHLLLTHPSHPSPPHPTLSGSGAAEGTLRLQRGWGCSLVSSRQGLPLLLAAPALSHVACIFW